MLPGAVRDQLDRLFRGHGGAIRTRRGQRIVEIGDAQYPPEERDRVALETVRIAAAVPFLVMVLNAGKHRRDRRALDVAENLGAVSRVLAHLRELFWCQFSGLVENGIGHGDLADVVQQRRQLRGLALGLGEPEFDGELRGEGGNPFGVAVRIPVARVNRRGDRLDRVQQQPFQLPHQADAVHGDSGLVANRRQQLEIRLVETPRRTEAVHVQRTEDFVGRAQRHAHHRPYLLADDTLAFAEARIAAGVVREHRHTIRDDARHQRPGDREALRRLSLRPRRQDLHLRRVLTMPPQDDGAAIGGQHVENGAQRHVRHALQIASRRQRFADRVQGGQVPLRPLEQRQFRRISFCDGEPLETRRLDAALDDGFHRRPIEEEGLVRRLRQA